ncbi:MAG: glycosyltransferase family 2 protein [Defluviimonas sp.]|uniref:glycosyltransferase family 2 protein n=1 Tax=Albidovulum sp. TaxID=1872424 RepID=UPI001DF436A5|nr:glycosyltransferase family 2 protein [Paracoccaceae bacterium]MCC0065150.1 glycosyltransferase family 2 protein [Defluviimonas sp.]
MYLKPDSQIVPGRGLPRVSIVIPCFNEEAALPHLLAALRPLCADMVESGRAIAPVEVLLVDDGSRDATWDLIRAAAETDDATLRLRGLKLSRNHGHQRALLAGLMTAKGEVVISMDADLQDDPRAALQMLDAWRGGAEIVYGQRSARDHDSAFKRMTARGFYSVMRRFGVNLVPDHADYRLMSRKALNVLARFGEENLFLRGVVPLIGLESAIVTYERPPRIAGETKYPLAKMLGLAIEGITSFSVRPLRMITWAGLGMAALSMAYLAYALGAWIVGGTVRGWMSMIVSMTLLGGMQMFALGVIGEYIGKIYTETKRRPRFIVDEIAEPHAESVQPMRHETVDRAAARRDATVF